MESIRIATTPLAGLRPIGHASLRDHGRLAACLARLDGETGRPTLEFADPEPSRDGGRIDWYAAGGRTYVPLAALPPDERARILDEVEAQFDALRREGSRLQAAGDAMGEGLINATSIPAPRDAYIFIGRTADEPPRRHAVIVCWAHGNDSPALSGLAPQVMAQPSPIPTPATVLAPAHSATLMSLPAATLPEPRRSRWWLLLWLALLVLLLAIAWLMLRACGMGLPGYGLFHHIGRAFCPGTAIAASMSDDERHRVLTDTARQLELQMAQRQVECLAERSSPSQAATPPPPSKITERLQREGAQSGELQVSLAWDGPADLDLHVVCPNGEKIYHSLRSGCGGTLDVDMNSQTGKKSTTPVENVFWPDGKAAEGRYRVVVVLYNRNGDNREPIPFEVRIKNGTAVRTVPGSTSQVGANVEVTEFVR